MVEKRNVVAEAGCTSGCDSHHLGGVGFLDDPLRPTLESFPTESYVSIIEGGLC